MRQNPRAPREQGMILINILLIVALASGVLLLMLRSDDADFSRSLMFSDAAQAGAIASGGELSAIAALRRDAAVAPDSDNAAEPWAAVAQKDVAIDNGRFQLRISDAQGRFNINNIAFGEPGTTALIATMARTLGLPADSADRITAALRASGPISSLTTLAGSGLTPDQIRQIAPLVTLLPAPTAINLNSVSEELLGIMLSDKGAAQRLIETRTRQGLLTQDDLTEARVGLPMGAEFTSRFFWVETQVTIGDVTQQRTSLLERRMRNAIPEVVAIARWHGAVRPVELADRSNPQ